MAYCEHHLALLGIKQLTRLRDDHLATAAASENAEDLTAAIALDEELRRRVKKHGRGALGHLDSVELTPTSIEAGIRLRQELRELMRRYCAFEIGLFAFDEVGTAEQIKDTQDPQLAVLNSGLVVRGFPTVGGLKSLYSCGGSNIYGELEPEPGWIDLVLDAFDRQIRFALVVRQTRGASDNLWPKFLSR